MRSLGIPSVRPMTTIDQRDAEIGHFARTAGCSCLSAFVAPSSTIRAQFPASAPIGAHEAEGNQRRDGRRPRARADVGAHVRHTGASGARCGHRLNFGGGRGTRANWAQRALRVGSGPGDGRRLRPRAIVGADVRATAASVATRGRGCRPPTSWTLGPTMREARPSTASPRGIGTSSRSARGCRRPRRRASAGPAHWVATRVAG